MPCIVLLFPCIFNTIGLKFSQSRCDNPLMDRIDRNTKSWASIPKYRQRTAGRPFFPIQGRKILKNEIVSLLDSQMGGILALMNDIQTQGSANKVKLGQKPLLQEDNLSTYLYDNYIHPRLFTEALRLIVANSERLISAQLCHLSQYHLADANKIGALDLYRDIGREFELFGSLMEERQLDILEKMKVINLAPAPADAPSPRVPRFALGEKLLGLAKLTQFPQTFFAFERTSIEATTLNERQLRRALEIFFEPENLVLADNTARTLREIGGTELTVKFHRTREGIVADFKAKGISQLLDSASILLIPKGAQQILC